LCNRSYSCVTENNIYLFNSGPTKCTLHSLFLSSLALHVSRANDEINKEYSVHIVGPELNTYLPRCTEPQTSKQNNTYNRKYKNVTGDTPL
jgi:hypothetical protein